MKKGRELPPGETGRKKIREAKFRAKKSGIIGLRGMSPAT